MDFSQYGGASEEWLKVQATLPAWTFDISQPIPELQQAVNSGREQAAAADFEPIRPQVTTKDYTIPTRDGATIEARSFRPVSKPAHEKLPVYQFFHGGGFAFGTLNTEDALCARLAINLDMVVLNVNYRHTPANTFPDAWLDAQDAYAWLHGNMDAVGGDASKVVVGGISAGGQLSASLTLEQNLGIALADVPPPAGQILMIPCLAYLGSYAEVVGKKLADPGRSSLVENEDAPLLPRRAVEFFVELLRAPAAPDLKDTKLNIVNAGVEDVRGLPPTVFGVAGLDPLRDEALLYAKTLAEAGVPTSTTVIKGIPHGFRRLGNGLRAAKIWDDVVENGIRWVLSKPVATGKFEVSVP